MKTRKKNGAKWCSLLLVVLMVVTAFVPATTVSAKNCEEWWTRRGLVDKAGDNENGYTIGSRGDTSFTVCRYEEKVDILATEIQFSFKAWPTDPNLKDSWAYLNFGLDFKESEFLSSREENAPTGRVQLTLNQRADGAFHLYIWDNELRGVIKLNNFDFDATHTISFEEKAMGIFIVFNGAAWTEYDFSSVFEKHVGENAGNTYIAVGGYEGYEFTNLKIVPKEKKVVSPEDYVAPDNSGGKLGDTEIKEPEEVEETFQMTPAIIAAIAISGVTVIAAIIITIYVVKKKKGKAKQKENGGEENEKI